MGSLASGTVPPAVPRQSDAGATSAAEQNGDGGGGRRTGVVQRAAVVGCGAGLQPAGGFNRPLILLARAPSREKLSSLRRHYNGFGRRSWRLAPSCRLLRQVQS